MPHISKRKLDQKTLNKLFKKLIAILEKARNQDKLSMILKELLTDTEKIMLAKRLALVLMLDSDIPQYRIYETLLMSPSTITRFSLGIELGKYNLIRSISKKDRIDLEKIIWLLLTAGGILPPRAGGRYWRKKGYKSYLEN